MLHQKERLGVAEFGTDGLWPACSPAAFGKRPAATAFKRSLSRVMAEGRLQEKCKTRVLNLLFPPNIHKGGPFEEKTIICSDGAPRHLPPFLIRGAVE